MIEDGITYEEEAITIWLKKHMTSPVTAKFLPSKDQNWNNTINDIIEDLLKKEE